MDPKDEFDERVWQWMLYQFLEAHPTLNDEIVVIAQAYSWFEKRGWKGTGLKATSSPVTVAMSKGFDFFGAEKEVIACLWVGHRMANGHEVEDRSWSEALNPEQQAVIKSWRDLGILDKVIFVPFRWKEKGKIQADWSADVILKGIAEDVNSKRKYPLEIWVQFVQH